MPRAAHDAFWCADGAGNCRRGSAAAGGACAIRRHGRCAAAAELAANCADARGCSRRPARQQPQGCQPSKLSLSSRTTAADLEIECRSQPQCNNLLARCNVVERYLAWPHLYRNPARLRPFPVSGHCGLAAGHPAQGGRHGGSRWRVAPRRRAKCYWHGQPRSGGGGGTQSRLRRRRAGGIGSGCRACGGGGPAARYISCSPQRDDCILVALLLITLACVKCPCHVSKT